MIPRHVETLFCDDIRQEVNGKVSFIGAYSAALFVSAFPATLPKLCLSVKVISPADDPLGSLTLRMFRGDDVLQEIVVDEEQISKATELVEELSEEEKKDRLQMAQFMLVFSPIQFESACTLKVRIQTEDGELRGMGLKVELLPSDKQ